MTEIEPSKSLVPARVIELDFASSKDGNDPDHFVVIPPKKEGRIDAVKFKDGTVIRRTRQITNQQNPVEILQMADPKTGIPPYKLGDPDNLAGLSVPRSSLE